MTDVKNIITTDIILLDTDKLKMNLINKGKAMIVKNTAN